MSMLFCVNTKALQYCTFFIVDGDWTSVDGGTGEVEGDKADGDELPPLGERPTAVGLLEPLPVEDLGDITFALLEESGDVVDVANPALAADGWSCWLASDAECVDANPSVPFSSLSFCSESNHISSSSSS